MLGGKGSPSLFYHCQVPGADIPIVDELVVHSAVCTSVVWLAHGQEIRREVSCDHLSSIHKNVSSKKSKCEHPYKEIEKNQE